MNITHLNNLLNKEDWVAANLLIEEDEIVREYAKEKLIKAVYQMESSASEEAEKIFDKLLCLDNIKKYLVEDDTTNALYYAIENDLPVIVKKFLDKLDTEEFENDYCLMFLTLADANLEDEWQPDFSKTFYTLLEYSKFQNILHLDDNLILREACLRRRTKGVEYLLTFEKVKENAHALKNKALQEACKQGAFNIAQQLLDIPAVRQDAAIKNNKALYRALNSHGGDKVKIVALLLEIEEVVDALFEVKEIEDSFANKLIKLFLNVVLGSMRDEPAYLPILIKILHNKKVAHSLPLLMEEKAPNLSSESAMDNFNFSQLNLETRLKITYSFPEEQLKEKWNALVSDLETRYNAAPCLNNKGEMIEILSLPIEPIEEDPRLLNRVHVAYRFFNRAHNPWMDPESKFVINKNGACYSNISRQEKILFVLIWQALHDPKYPPLDNNKPETILEFFLENVYQIARAHNWDNSRERTELLFSEANKRLSFSTKEFYDDNKRDNLSCSGGMALRAIVGLEKVHSFFVTEFKELTSEKIESFFKENLITANSYKDGVFDKIDELNLAQLEVLHYSLIKKCQLEEDYLIEKTPSQEELKEVEKIFLALNVDQFIFSCFTLYGIPFITTPVKHGVLTFDNCLSYVNYLSHNYLEVYMLDIFNKVTRNINRERRSEFNEEEAPQRKRFKP